MDCDYIPFSDLLSEIVDNRGKTCPTSKAGIPLIATNCIHNDSLYPTYEKIRFVSEETYENWFRGHPKPGDMILVLKGTYMGKLCLVPDPVDFCIAQDMVAVRADETRVYPKYLFSLLRSQKIQNQIERMQVGTLIPHFKKGDFDKLLLPVPDIETQKLIGDLYFNISLKIELNRRMSKNLEALAKAIFKSWFIDFDPITSKAENRNPALIEQEIATLFPDTFDDTEMGFIPTGWKFRVLGEILDVIETGSRPKGGVNNILMACLALVQKASLVWVSLTTRKQSSYHWNIIRG
jgi:type I restriction enzyme, S subunit